MVGGQEFSLIGSIIFFFLYSFFLFLRIQFGSSFHISCFIFILSGHPIPVTNEAQVMLTFLPNEYVTAQNVPAPIKLGARYDFENSRLSIVTNRILSPKVVANCL